MGDARSLADNDRGFAHGVNGLSRRARRLTRCLIGVFLFFSMLKTLIKIRFTITRYCSVEKTEIRIEDMMHNKLNIAFVTKQLEKALKDIETLKDKVRANGKGTY